MALDIQTIIKHLCNSTPKILQYIFIATLTVTWCRGHPISTSNFSTEDYKLWEYLSNDTLKLRQPFHMSIDQIAMCPEPFQHSNAYNCQSSTCTSDSNCTDTGQICCFNGCVYTCRDHLPPPPALDWIIDRSNLSSANSIEEAVWLGSLSCSTTVHSLPALIRGCPEGFKCHIYEVEDPIMGIPNKGLCISDEKPDPESDTESLSASATELSGCLLTSSQYKDLEGFLKGGHYDSCKCDDDIVMCKVKYNNTLIAHQQSD